jgi:hypothetical protein
MKPAHRDLLIFRRYKFTYTLRFPYPITGMTHTMVLLDKTTGEIAKTLTCQADDASRTVIHSMTLEEIAALENPAYNWEYSQSNALTDPVLLIAGEAKLSHGQY